MDCPISFYWYASKFYVSFAFIFVFIINEGCQKRRGERLSSCIENLNYEFNLDQIIYPSMKRWRFGLEELEVQNGEFSKFSSMPPVEKQELAFTRKKKKLKSVYFDSNGS